ncbi:hypothetical protein ACIBCC_35170 [Streptomyces griseus]|uniref:hypothetical protein n=1 Tax=Streptomyces griseus TaxID=1911 RepID=UPI0037A9641C
MLMVAERMVRRLQATLAEEIDRQEQEDDRRGPEPEAAVVVTRTVLPVGPGWVEREPVEVPALSLPGGYIVARPVVGADEMRARHLMVAAIGRYGSGRDGGAL